MRFIRLFIVPMALGLVPDDLSHLFDADRAEYPVLEFMSDLSPPPHTGVLGDRSAVRLGQNQVRVEFSEEYMRSLDRRIAASYRGQLVMDEFFSQLTPTPKNLKTDFQVGPFLWGVE